MPLGIRCLVIPGNEDISILKGSDCKVFEPFAPNLGPLLRFGRSAILARTLRGSALCVSIRRRSWTKEFWVFSPVSALKFLSTRQFNFRHFGMFPNAGWVTFGFFCDYTLQNVMTVCR